MKPMLARISRTDSVSDRFVHSHRRQKGRLLACLPCFRPRDRSSVVGLSLDRSLSPDPPGLGAVPASMSRCGASDTSMPDLAKKSSRDIKRRGGDLRATTRRTSVTDDEALFDISKLVRPLCCPPPPSALALSLGPQPSPPTQPRHLHLPRIPRAAEYCQRGDHDEGDAQADGRRAA